MKKINSILSAAALLVAAACSHEIINPDIVKGPSDLKEMTFTASVENDGSKTSLIDGKRVVWDSNDAISVFSASSNNRFTLSSYDETTGVASFTGMSAESSSYLALYPYMAGASADKGDITMEFPSEQTAVAESFDPAAALTVAKSGNTEFLFSQVGSLIGFTLGNQDVKSVTFHADQNLAGKIKVIAKEPVNGKRQAPEITVVEGCSHVTLSGDFQANTMYYVSVLPGTYTGIKVEVIDAEGSMGTLSNSQPLVVKRAAALKIGRINITNWIRSYVLDGHDEVQAFYDAKGPERETVYNLTVKGADVTDTDMNLVKGRVERVLGTARFKDLPKFQTEFIFFNEGHQHGGNGIHFDGSIIIEDCVIDNPNGPRAIEVVNGDLIFRNVNWAFDWNGTDGLREVKGDLVIDGNTRAMGNFKFPNLERVGGDLVINDCNNSFWDFGGAPKLSYIGGTLSITDCQQWAFWYENNAKTVKKNLTHAGGVIMLNTGTGTNPNDYCRIREWIRDGVIPAGAPVMLGNTDNLVSIDNVPYCDGTMPVGDVVLSGKAEVEAFIASHGSAVTVRNLTVSGSDVSASDIGSLAAKIQKVEGTLTIDGICNDYTDGFDLNRLNGFNWKDSGNLVVQNISVNIYPNGDALPEVVNGSLTLKNLPNLKVDDGWAQGCWGKIKEVKGNLHFENCSDHLWGGQDFPNLERVGGDLELARLPKCYLRMHKLTNIGGSLNIHDVEQGEWMTWGEDGFHALETVGGSLILSNISGGINSGAFPLLKTIKGDLVMNGLGSNVGRGLLEALEKVEGDVDLSAIHGWFHLTNLAEVGGDFRLHDCSDKIFSEGYDGVTALAKVGGDFVLKNLAKEQFLLFPELAQVGGSFEIDNVHPNSFNYGSTRLMFDRLSSVGENFAIRNISDESDIYLRFAALSSVGGDLVLEEIPSDMFMHGETREGFPALASVGGSLRMSGFLGSMGGGYESMRLFKSLKTVRGGFTVENISGAERFHDNEDGSASMQLRSVGGDLVIVSCPDFRSFSGFDNMTSIGGDVVVNQCSGSWGVQTTDNANVGFCLIKEYVRNGIIGGSVSIPYDLSALSACSE